MTVLVCSTCGDALHALRKLDRFQINTTLSISAEETAVEKQTVTCSKCLLIEEAQRAVTPPA